MTKTLLLLVALLAFAAQDHREPAKGWFCGNMKETPVDHRCACHRTCALNKDTGEIEEHEDVKCRVYCHRDHCACLSECDS